MAFQNSSREVIEKRTEQRGSHSEKLFLFIEELQQEHGLSIPELEAVLVSEGPGSYTGLRIAASAVKGLLFERNVPLFSVNTLAGFARSAVASDPELTVAHAIIDARRVHLYHQKYRLDGEEGIIQETEVAVRPIKEFEREVQGGEVVVGTGSDRLSPEVMDKVQVLDSSYITAVSLIDLYDEQSKYLRQADPEMYEPRYYTNKQVSDDQ